MFIKAVGAHPTRVSNLYFTFLFVARAVAKAGTILSAYDYSIGDEAEHQAVQDLVRHLVKVPGIDVADLPMDPTAIEAAMQCKNGFDESILFQVGM